MSVKEEYKLEEVDPVLTEGQLEAAVKPIIEEYFEHGNTTEVEVSFILALLCEVYHSFMFSAYN
jgi:hypothetical protein